MQREWTASEEEIIRQHYLTMQVGVIAKWLNRTERSVMNRAYVLGVRKFAQRHDRQRPSRKIVNEMRRQGMSIIAIAEATDANPVYIRNVIYNLEHNERKRRNRRKQIVPSTDKSNVNPQSIIALASDSHTSAEADRFFEPRKSIDWVATEHEGGTKGKIEVLAARIERGEPLWHPDDNPEHLHQEKQTLYEIPQVDFSGSSSRVVRKPIGSAR